MFQLQDTLKKKKKIHSFKKDCISIIKEGKAKTVVQLACGRRLRWEVLLGLTMRRRKNFLKYSSLGTKERYRCQMMLSCKDKNIHSFTPTITSKQQRELCLEHYVKGGEKLESKPRFKLLSAANRGRSAGVRKLRRIRGGSVLFGRSTFFYAKAYKTTILRRIMGKTMSFWCQMEHRLHPHPHPQGEV